MRQPTGQGTFRMALRSSHVWLPQELMWMPTVGSTLTPRLHWAASSDDLAVLDALLDAGADIEAPGAVLGGGSALADACGFGN